MITRVYLQGVNVVVQRTQGDDQSQKFIPTRASRLTSDPTSDSITVSDRETNDAYTFDYGQLRTKSDGDFATKELAVEYLAGFVGGFKAPQGGGDGDFNPAEHSVIEFNDVTTAGSGMIITNQERNNLQTNTAKRSYPLADQQKLGDIDSHGIISELGFDLGDRIQSVYQLIGTHAVQFNALNASNWVNVAVTASRSNGSGGSITETITLNSLNINPGAISAAQFTFTENDANVLALGVGPINFSGVATDSGGNAVANIHIGQINVVPIDREIKDFVVNVTGIENSANTSFDPGDTTVVSRTTILDFTDLPPVEESYFTLRIGSTNEGSQFLTIEKFRLFDIPKTANVEEGATFEVNAPGGGINRVLISWTDDGNGGVAMRVLFPISFAQNSQTVFFGFTSQKRAIIDTWHLNRSGGISVNMYDIVPRIGYSGGVIGIAAKTRSGSITYRITKNGVNTHPDPLTANNTVVINNQVNFDFQTGDSFQLVVLSEPQTAQDLFLSIEVERPIE